MAQAIARLGDSSSHGGHIITASSNVLIDGIGVARLNDSHSCPILGHGVTPLVSASSLSQADDRGIVRVGDRAGCGAIITSGSSNVVSG